MVLWDECAARVAREFPEVTWEKELVDAMAARMVSRPASIDTVVASNLHADILSDLAAALAGSMGIAPTGNLDPERRYPSMFEPIHGSAFDIVGQGIANPIGTFWSCVLMLEHLGEREAAQNLMKAIESVTATKALHTKDLGGNATTEMVTTAVIARVQSGAQLPHYSDIVAEWDLPPWLQNEVERVRHVSATDIFSFLRRSYTSQDGPNTTDDQLLRIRCHDCPGRQYALGPGLSLHNFEVHLNNRDHKANVIARLQQAGQR
jgi:hypothetical protein